MAFAGVTDRRLISLSRPLFSIFEIRPRLEGHPHRRPVSITLTKVEGSGVVRTGHDAVPAANAGIVIDRHDPVRPLPSSTDRADWDAWWIIALHAWAGNETTCNVRKFSHFFLKYGSIDHAWRQNILAVAADRAGVTPDALS